jgi:citrate lyase synthetase
MNVRGCVVFDLKEKEMNDLRYKISQSEDFDFTKDEKELMFKMVGFDLLTSSELKCIGILYLAKELEK